MTAPGKARATIVLYSAYRNYDGKWELHSEKAEVFPKSYRMKNLGLDAYGYRNNIPHSAVGMQLGSGGFLGLTPAEAIDAALVAVTDARAVLEGRVARMNRDLAGLAELGGCC